MATLTPKQLAGIRRTAVKNISPIDFKKHDINNASQRIENLFQSVKAEWSVSVNEATAPYTFTNPAKMEIFRAWFQMKFNEEGI